VAGGYLVDVRMGVRLPLPSSLTARTQIRYSVARSSRRNLTVVFSAPGLKVCPSPPPTGLMWAMYPVGAPPSVGASHETVMRVLRGSAVRLAEGLGMSAVM